MRHSGYIAESTQTPSVAGAAPSFTRRDVLRLLGSLPLLAACGSGGNEGTGFTSAEEMAVQADGELWPMTGRDLAATRRAPLAPAGLSPRWRTRLAGGVLGAPAVRDGMVYAASFGGEVVAVELESGRERWRRQFPLAQYGDAITQVGSRGQAFYTGPATDASRLWIASDRVWCLDQRSGETVWETAPLRSDDSDDYFWGAPVLAGTLLLVGSGSGSELPRARGAVTAYDRDTGALRWSTRMVPPGGNGGGVIAPVSVDPAAGRVYAVTGAPYAAVEGDNPGTTSLIELDLHNGRVLWSDQAFLGDTEQRDFNSAPMLVGDYVFATNKDGVWAWDRRRRERLWQRGLTPSSPLPGVVGAGLSNEKKKRRRERGVAAT
jgi:outer membrane protein assembly factor BamB